MTLESILLLITVLDNLAKLLFTLFLLIQGVYAFGRQTGFWRRLRQQPQPRRKRPSRRR